MNVSRLIDSPYSRLACLFLASRLALFAVGLLSTWLLPSGAAVQKGNLVAHESVPRPLEMWARWDSEWYLLIAAEGYDVGDHFVGLGVSYERHAASGFLPLYPFLIRSLTPLLGAVAAGVLISNLCLALSLVLLERLVRLEVPGAKGETAASAACAALLLHPSSLFLSAVYAESLFLALSLGVFLFARRRRFAVAGILGGLATITRPFGVLLVIPILWEWWAGRHDGSEAPDSGRFPIWSGLWALAIPIALGGYMLFCRSVFGDPAAFIHRQASWRGGLSGPWRAFVRWWEVGPTAHGSHGSTFELFVALVCLIMLVFMARRLRGSYTLYAGAGVTMALGSTLWSFSRLTLTLFPFVMLIGIAWAEGRKFLPLLYAFMGATLGGLFVALFANWWWVG
ncbi:MAG: mannosyltransferase family protein [Thermoanaerobaculales bacterium]